MRCMTGSMRKLRQTRPDAPRFAGLGPALALALALALASACAPVAAQDAGVQWSGGRLSVQAGNQSIGAVLKNIQSRTGIAVTSYDALSEPVVRGFDRLPLAVGLKKLLSQHNHMIIEAGRRRPLRVYVLGGSAVVLELASGSPTVAAATSPAHSARQSDLASTDAATRIEAVERLADQGDAASLAAIRQALTDPAEAVRVVAQQALVTRLAKPAP
jgi:hypothetical protein